MIAVRRLLVLPILLGAVLAFSALAAAPEPAQADHCQIEVALGLPPLFPEADDPRCRILSSLGCPNLQDAAGCARGVGTYVLNRVCEVSTAVCYIRP